jgi:hypothetical protein
LAQWQAILSDKFSQSQNSILERQDFSLYSCLHALLIDDITFVLERVLFDHSGINQLKIGTGRHEFPQNYNLHSDSFVLWVNVQIMGCQSGVGIFIKGIKFYIVILFH